MLNLSEKTMLVRMRFKRGAHCDVYEDFEESIVRYTGWKSVKGTINILERIFEKIFLPRLAYREFPFDIRCLNQKKILFATLSGIEYIKIFQRYVCKAKLKAIYQFDTWTHDNAVNEHAFRSFKINIAFLSIRKAVEYFNSLGIPDFRAYWIPEAVSCDKYRSLPYKQKMIDVLQYGRRWEGLHKKLVPFCNQKEILYRYPEKDFNGKEHLGTREDLINSLAAAKIAVCVPKSITHSQIYDLETITTRYFEGMASKCLLWGHAPADLCDILGYNPVIEIDELNPEAQLLDILDRYDDFIDLIERNYMLVSEKHQWKNRVEEMVKIIQATMMSRI